MAIFSSEAFSGLGSYYMCLVAWNAQGTHGKRQLSVVAIIPYLGALCQEHPQLHTLEGHSISTVIRHVAPWSLPDILFLDHRITRKTLWVTVPSS